MRLAKLDTVTRSIAVLTLAVGAGCVSGPHGKSASFSRSIDALFAQWNKPASPGCALAVIKEGKIIYKRCYGCANLEYGTPITPSSVFNIASASKQFTAMSVLLLVQQGKLSLDDDIRKYVSEIPDFGRVITIRHLVHHTSGLRNFEDLLPMAGWRDGDMITRKNMLDLVSHQKELNFNPGEEYLYCNTGYHLLAEIVARVSGQSFAEFADANIFKPLGMTNTHFHDYNERIVRNRAFSYSPVASNSFENVFVNQSVVGGGGMYSTVEDLAKWVSNFDHGRVGGAGVLKQMHEQGVLNNGQTISYAFGLFIHEYEGKKLVEHGGEFAGYQSDIIRLPDQKIAVVLLATTSAIDATQLTRQVADIVLFGAPPQKPIGSQQPKSSPHSTTTVSAGNLDPYCGVYEFKPGTFGTITREGDRLYAKATGGPKVELLPETENAFLIKEDGSRISFERDERGQVNRLTIQLKKKDWISDKGSYAAQRINPLRDPLRAEELAEFIGDYSSDELGTTYTIVVRNGQLLAQHRRLGDSRLTQTPLRDQFSGEGWLAFHFAFTRDPRNQVTGFKLTAERSRNVRFQKRLETVSPDANQHR